jgi:hypothetical protein
MKVTISSCIIPTLAVLSHLSSPTSASTDAAAQRRFKVAIDAKQPIFSSCAESSLVAQVLTSKGKAVPNKPVTLYIATAARSGATATAITKTARTGRTGKATFDVSLTDQQKQQLAGQELKCSVAVENKLVRGGKQVVPCPKSMQVCQPPPDCISSGSVVCEGDMEFDSMCDALAQGLTEDDCVTEEYDPECERISGYVKCTGPFGEYWFENYCIARSYGNSRNMCEYVEDSDVPECARSGEVVCVSDGGSLTYVNMCQAASEGMDEASCKPNQ